MSFLPGEPVPPGFEEDVSRTAVIQKQIESYTAGPLIGTEYTIELHEPAQLRPNYFCVLCQTCSDGRNVFVHWTSQAHRTKYLQTHFQKAYKELQKLKRTPNSSGDLVTATGNLVKCIEKHFGRSRNLITATGDDFRRYRSKMCSQVRDSFHFDECAGSDFSEEAQRVIRELKPDESIKSSMKKNVDGTGDSNKQHDDGNIIALDAISSDDESFGGSTASVVPVPKGRQKNNLSEDAGGRSKNQSPPPAGGVNKTQHLPTPKELAIQASKISQERYKWEKFRCMLEIQLKQLRSDTEMYESNPEKHPDYPDEWKQFWNRRYKQLQEEKKCDPNQYDYKPEWISYWKDRRIVLFDIAVNKIKKDLKEKFKLGDEDEEKTLELMERYKIRVASPRRAPATTNSDNCRKTKPNFRNNRPIVATSKLPDAVIDISDDDVDSPPSRSRHSHKRRSISRSLSPKRGGRRAVRRSRSRSPRRSYNRGSTRSRSRSMRHRSRSPAHYRGRGRGREPASKERGSSSRDFGGRHSLQRERERSSEYYHRNEGYARSSRGYESVETFRVLDSRVYPEYKVTKTSSISPTASSNKEKEKEASEPIEEGPLTVVSVLRMLSAVEEHLGSLGPKALNLLSKALAMELVKPNAAEDLLRNEDNCVFLETTKEKLKGILIAEVLDDPQKVRVIKKLITNIAEIIYQATFKGKSTTKPAQSVSVSLALFRGRG